jgi:hypothetical protein
MLALAKKLHVLSALEVERHRSRTTAKNDLATLTMGGTEGIAKATAATLDTLMMTSLDTQGEFLLLYICNFHILSHLLLIYICKLHWN